MKKLNKLAVLFATVAVAGSAMAAGSTTNSDNWRNNHDNLQWKNGTNELCWRNNFWTPASAAAGCDGAIVATKAAPAPAPAPVAAPAVSSRVTFSADAFFDFDKATLKPEGKATLNDLAAKVKGINLETLITTGHTDSVGSDAYNQRLSVRRANAVKAYLVSQGVAADRIVVEGKGESKPVATNKTAAGRAKNRRVEVEVVGSR